MWPHFKNNNIWKLGNGSSVRIQEDHWILDVHRIGDLAMINLEGDFLNLRVSKYTTNKGDWDWNKLNQILPLDYIELLIPIKAPNLNVIQVYIAWFPTADGKFTLKIAYKSWFKENRLNRIRLHKNIWKVITP